ncbi:MAG TPA: amidohydrolase family protein [Nitrososphaerales archaeon]|nr:amidohydrolase family protein [Nitrososphaerales archaeon]
MSTILTNCNVINVENGEILDNASIGIKDRKIVSVGQRNEYDFRSRIDLRGEFVLPGLFNVHNNLSNVFPFKNINLNESQGETVLRCYGEALKALRAGVTTLRTMGEINRADLVLKKAINNGVVAGPRIIASGKGLGVTGGHGSGLGQTEADTPDEFRKAARKELAMGADHLKIFITGGIANKEETFEEPQMSQADMEAVVSVANSKGTYVGAHAGSSNPIMTAVKAGVRSIEHAYVLDIDTAIAMKESGCVLVPTLSVTRSPVWMKDHNFENWTIEKALSAGETHLRSIRTAVEQGVVIGNGTDLPPGDLNDGVVTTVREIQFLHEAGLSNVEAIKAATINSAKLCRLSSEVGLVKENYFADLITVPRNPLKDLKELENIQFVMKDGQVVRNDI